MKKTDCNPQTIVDSIEAIDNNADKIGYIENILYSCGTGVEDIKEPVKLKRKMSGWNCYLKKCTETGIPFKTCLIDSKRKEKEYIPKKEYWKEQARLDCA